MQDEVAAEKAAQEQADAEQAAEEEAKEDTTPSEEGTLVDPNTGETVKMPTEEEVQAEGDDGFLGGYESPILPGGGGSAEE